MAASYIPELDSGAVDRKVLTEVYDTDKHAVAGVTYVNGAIVATANPWPVTSATLSTSAKQDSELALLGTIDADTSVLSGAIVTRSVSPSAGQTGLAGLAVLDAALTDQSGSDADGEMTPIRTDTYGATWVQMAGALDSVVDSVAVGVRTTGGATPYYNSDLDENKVAMKGSAGTVYGWHFVNLTAADLFVRFWDVASGSVTNGTTAPTFVIPVPVSSTVHGGVTVCWPMGIAFATAITIACSTTTGTSGTAGPATSGFSATILYK